MISMADYEAIRRAYFVDKKSIRQIARERGHSRKTVRKAIANPEPRSYTLQADRPAPVLGPFKDRIQQLWRQNRTLPRKQRWSARTIYLQIKKEGYAGAESTVRGFVGKLKEPERQREVFLPLEFDPGRDAQVDWGEAEAVVGGVLQVVQLFVMRLCYSRRMFMMAFPAQKQEAFFEGHCQAFAHFGGVPGRITYDNLKAAVQKVLEGRSRQEQKSFVLFRSFYVFESRFCTPGKGHEKGRVEDAVGFARRRFMVPVPEVASFAELNELLARCCREDEERTVSGQEQAIGEAFRLEQPHLQPLPDHSYDCCVSRPVQLSSYGQVAFETNRYSVPTDRAYPNLLLKAYPLEVRILRGAEVLAVHPRSYEQNTDVIDPLHYLPLLEQRPGAFEHAKPLRRWRKQWPPVYEQLLEQLRRKWPKGRGIREFVQILALHKSHPDEVVRAAVTEALRYGAVHTDGVKLCLRQHAQPNAPVRPLSFEEEPAWAQVGSEAPSLHTYNELLERI